MLKLYYKRKASNEIIDFGEYDTLQGLKDDLLSFSSHCLCGTYLIVNDALIRQVKVTLDNYGSNKKIIGEWEINERIVKASDV